MSDAERAALLRRIAEAYWRSSLGHGPTCPSARRDYQPCDCGHNEFADLLDELPPDLQPEAFGL